MKLSLVPVIWKKEVKNNQSEQQEEKVQKKMKIMLGATDTTSCIPAFESWRCQMEKRASKKFKAYVSK